MSEFKGTPGPYHIEFFASAPDKPFVCSDVGDEDPVINEFSEIGGTEVAWANATLAAASWDMLKALQEIDEGLKGDLPVTAAVKEIARAAIAKALGDE